jgi:hypothetical protein
MVLRLWTEPGDRLRVRITTCSRLESRDVATSYASTTTEVVALVQDWLDSFVTPR